MEVAQKSVSDEFEIRPQMLQMILQMQHTKCNKIIKKKSFKQNEQICFKRLMVKVNIDLYSALLWEPHL